MNNKLNLLLGFHSHIPDFLQKNSQEKILVEKTTSFINNLISSLLKDFHTTKTTFHISGDLITFLDKKSPDFSLNIRTLLEKNQIELLSGGIYEPLFPFTPKEDRQTQISLMNRLLNHTYGYTPSGAWVTELSWEPSLALDLAKSRIEYTCLPKDYFNYSGLSKNNLSGYYLTEEEGRKIAVFPISFDLNELMQKFTPEETIENLLKESLEIMPETKSLLAFYKIEKSDESNLNWIKSFLKLIENKKDSIETKLFNEYFSCHKPNGRIYIPPMQNQTSKDPISHWKHSLLKYYEANLLHKKMLRVSKKINSAKEGKSRFKVIKEMINQAQDLLLKGQSSDAYWHSFTGGIYLPEVRHNTYNNLIKAENLIDAASRHTTKWIQVYELDYDCDGTDEIIVETETQNIYISPGLGGTILEHDYRPKNLNILCTISRQKEEYHESNGLSKLKENRKLVYDNYLKLNFIDHFLINSPDLDSCKNSKLNHLTKEILFPYNVEKIKVKEEVCKITLSQVISFTQNEAGAQVEANKQINIRSGDASLITDYKLQNKSNQKINFTFGVEFNFNITPQDTSDAYFYLEGDKNLKSLHSTLTSSEELQNTSQISICNNSEGTDLTFSWNKPSKLFRYPVETLSYKCSKLENIYQGTTVLSLWDIKLNENETWELSIKQNIASLNEEI